MSGPKDNEEKMEQILQAWQTLASKKSFGGLTLEEFTAQVEVARAKRQRLAELEDQRTQALAEREQADEDVATQIERIIAGVVADPTEGPDSALYQGMGRIPKSHRKTGLTRKRKEPGKK